MASLPAWMFCGEFVGWQTSHPMPLLDRESTPLNSRPPIISYPLFFFNDPATAEIYPLALHDALPTYLGPVGDRELVAAHAGADGRDVRDRGFLGAVVAVEAVDAELAGVNVVREVDGLASSASTAST